MLNLLKKKWYETKNKNKEDICKHCVWWKSEEENNVDLKDNVRYCDLEKKYTPSHYSCFNFWKEMFEAKPNSTQTPELDLNLDMEWSKSD